MGSTCSNEIKRLTSRKEQEVWTPPKEVGWSARAHEMEKGNGRQGGDIATDSASRAEIWRGLGSGGYHANLHMQL
jgi:hypothetical protein